MSRGNPNLLDINKVVVVSRAILPLLARTVIGSFQRCNNPFVRASWSYKRRPLLETLGTVVTTNNRDKSIQAIHYVLHDMVTRGFGCLAKVILEDRRICVDSFNPGVCPAFKLQNQRLQPRIRSHSIFEQCNTSKGPKSTQLKNNQIHVLKEDDDESLQNLTSIRNDKRWGTEVLEGFPF